MTNVAESTLSTASLHPLVRQAVDFTEAYCKHRDDDPATREAACLKTQYPAILADLRPDDLFAGRRGSAWITYVGPIWWTAFPGWRKGQRSEGKQGGYCFDFSAAGKHAATEEDRRAIEQLSEFWESECSVAQVQSLWDDELRQHTGNECQVAGTSIGFCLALDFDRLLQRGIPGLAEDIRLRREQAEKAGEDTLFCDALSSALDVLKDVCLHYARQASTLAAEAEGGNAHKRMALIADDLEAIIAHPPRTLHQAIQLLWLYNLLASAKHLEGPRMDVALGDFFAGDLDDGTLDYDQALTQLLALWTLFHENGEAAVCRIVVGGTGRRNVAAADRFAAAAMEATRRFRQVVPQLTLRFHRDQDPALLRQAYSVIGEGCIYPMLYNDDVVVPGVAQALGVSIDEAGEYHPLGCGEYMLAHSSPSLLCSVWSLPKTVEAALRNGLNSDGKPIGPATGCTDSLDTFEKLYDAVLVQIRFAADLSAHIYQAICQVYSGHCAFLLGSLLTDDCLARNRALFDGGVRHRGACEMGHGFTNAADSLTAIRKVVYEDRSATLAEVVTALDANFEGPHAVLRKRLLDAPKFGNDDPSADVTLVSMWRDINAAACDAGKAVGLDFLIVSSVNPGGYGMGQSCGATADGRKSGQPFAIGNAPTAGCDRKGLTALCNSVAKVDPVNGGAVTNFKLSRELFLPNVQVVETLFGVYFANGGQQASITVVNRDDLEAALVEPAKYTHVLVRLGGWSARFVDLEPAIQQEILRRTLY